jgi:hypothetical protein
MRNTSRVAIVALLLCAALAFAAKNFQMPRVYHAKTYPARDEHVQEKVTIAADPYDTEDKQQIFSVDFREHELLPVLLIVTNDGDTAVNLTSMKLEMMTAGRQKLVPASQQDIVRRIQKAVKRPDSPRVSPIPLPRRKPKPGVSQDTMDELDAAMFHAMAVEPHTTRAGFVFLDYEGISNPLAGARLTVNGLTTGDGKELFFFEIPMEKYLTYQPGKTP